MYRFSVLLLLAFGSLCTAQQGDKLVIHVFYESLCPDSIRFFVEQLMPNYDDLVDYMDVVLVPFGKSRSQQGGELFTCQHGPTECRLNRIMSCSLARFPLEQQQVHYVGCQMVSSADRTGRKCVEAHGLDFDDVTQCHDGLEGRNLQLSAEAEQNRVIGYPGFVPTIVANEQYSSQMQNSLLRNFKATVCGLINHAAPTCQN